MSIPAHSLTKPSPCHPSPTLPSPFADSWKCALQVAPTWCHACTHMHVYAYIPSHMHTHTLNCTHSRMCTHSHAHRHIFPCTHTLRPTHTLMHTYTHSHVCTHLYAVMYTHAHTHTHIHSPCPDVSCLTVGEFLSLEKVSLCKFIQRMCTNQSRAGARRFAGTRVWRRKLMQGCGGVLLLGFSLMA